MFRRDLTGTTRSGKTFKRDLDLGVEYSPLLGVSDSDKESGTLKTPQGVLQKVNQGIMGIPHPSTPPPLFVALLSVPRLRKETDGGNLKPLRVQQLSLLNQRGLSL